MDYVPKLQVFGWSSHKPHSQGHYCRHPFRSLKGIEGLTDLVLDYSIFCADTPKLSYFDIPERSIPDNLQGLNITCISAVELEQLSHESDHLGMLDFLVNKAA
jgi:hypothetical protein